MVDEPDRIAQWKKAVSARSNEVMKVLEAGGIDITDITTYTACGLIFALGMRSANVDREIYLFACGDAYDNAEVYEKEAEGAIEED